MMTFTDVVFSGSNAKGERITRTVKRIKAADVYEAGDAIKARFAKYDVCVTLKFGNPRKLDSASISARVSRNAGPEEM